MNDTVAQPTYAFEGFRLDAQHRVLSRANGEPIPWHRKSSTRCSISWNDPVS